MPNRKPEFPTPWRVDHARQMLIDADGWAVLTDWRAIWAHLTFEQAMQQFERIAYAVNAAEHVATTWRHRKRGTTYREVGRAELQSESPISEGAALVVYRGEDGKLWARPEAEFMDGRFEAVNAAEGKE